MDLGGKVWKLGLRGGGELVRKRKRTCGWCFNVWKQKKDLSTCYRIASPDNPEENPEFPDSTPEYPGSPRLQEMKVSLSRILT